MDTYLWIAREILRRARRPLGPKVILAIAYRSGIVPQHLHGKTQHKTLQARLSEDIVARRERSAFFRPEPGKFFLREFLADSALPEKYRQPFVTRRRVRQLERASALAFDLDVLAKRFQENSVIPTQYVLGLLNSSYYQNIKDRTKKSVFLRSFVCVRRGWEILSYRAGHYRDDRDEFIHRRSIGFSTLVHESDRNLFNYTNYGIIDAGVRATKIDLDIPTIPLSMDDERKRATLLSFMWVKQDPEQNDLLAVITFDCPSWFEPAKRRLALNDLHWFDTRILVNNIDDFDPWSQFMLNARHRKILGMATNVEDAERGPYPHTKIGTDQGTT